MTKTDCEEPMPMKRTLVWICLVLFLLPVATASAAAQGSSGYDFSQITLEDAMADFISRNQLDGGNYAVSYTFTGTGETYQYHETTYFVGGSIYKLPLCMLYRDKIDRGEMTEQTIFSNGVSFSDMEFEILVHSNNDYGLYLLRRWPQFRSYRLELAQYTEMDPDTLDPLYYADNNFCTAFFLQILEYLYTNRDLYATEISYLEQAQPGEYLRRYVDAVPVAQKYGWYDGAVNTVGIVETDTPYLIAVFTDHLYDAENIIGQTNLIFYDYTTYLMEQAQLRAVAAQAEASARAVRQAQQALGLALDAAAADTAPAGQLAQAVGQTAGAAAAAQKPLSADGARVHYTASYFSAAVCVLLLIFLWIAPKKHRR